MSDIMKKIGKGLLVTAGVVAAGIAIKKWLDGKQELREIVEDEDIFEEEERSERVHVEKLLAEAKTVELSGELSDMAIRTVASSVTFDLSDTVMSADRIIEIHTICSNIRIESPIGVRVLMTGDGRLSSLQCCASVPEEEDVPVLRIHINSLASAVFVK